MISVLLVSIGGFFGAIGRFAVSQKRKRSSNYPFGTLSVNLIGSLLLGFFVSIELHTFTFQLIGVGFLGAFTTFSTFQLELFHMMKDKKSAALIYLFSSLLGGIILAAIGYWVGSFFQ
jgi:fluoride exporter